MAKQITRVRQTTVYLQWNTKTGAIVECAGTVGALTDGRLVIALLDPPADVPTPTDAQAMRVHFCEQDVNYIVHCTIQNVRILPSVIVTLRPGQIREWERPVPGPNAYPELIAHLLLTDGAAKAAYPVRLTQLTMRTLSFLDAPPLEAGRRAQLLVELPGGAKFILAGKVLLPPPDDRLGQTMEIILPSDMQGVAAATRPLDFLRIARYNFAHIGRDIHRRRLARVSVDRVMVSALSLDPFAVVNRRTQLQVLDMSTGGMRVSSTDPLREGDRLQFDFPLESGFPLTLQIALLQTQGPEKGSREVIARAKFFGLLETDRQRLSAYVLYQLLHDNSAPPPMQTEQALEPSLA